MSDGDFTARWTRTAADRMLGIAQGSLTPGRAIYTNTTDRPVTVPLTGPILGRAESGWAMMELPCPPEDMAVTGVILMADDGAVLLQVHFSYSVALMGGDTLSFPVRAL